MIQFTESAALVKEMINQVAQLHPGIKWFHVGADEVGNNIRDIWKLKQRGDSN